ncbi:DUF2726 domain-containing protein [Caloranaerobacter ferrireducens]|uniref:DUF2726 domain-containing protein n=1 Tax=Caloranaerobacter ferrireducens TaxID=1323370 RepID=UPI00084DE508|nr:DUF2726 domain-containing protein [Caloranaerobacter ferrireducens]
MYYIIIVLIIIYITYNYIIKLKKTENNVSIKLPYKSKKHLLSKAEYNFYKTLTLAIKEKNLYICPKVRLADILYVDKTEKRQLYWNKINSKHIDFLICESETLKPVLAIELDDSTHNKSERIERDEFLNNVFKSTNLPLLRIKVGYGYKVNELKNKIEEILNPTKIEKAL